MDFTIPAELIGKYIDNRQNEVGMLRELLAHGKYELIANKAHNIKGNAASFGFPELGVVAQQMEAAALDMHKDQVQQGISSIEKWLQDVKALDT